MAFPSFPTWASALLAAVLAFSTPSHADSLQDAQRLLKQGQLKEALERTDQVIAAKPKDAQARFLKGLILTEMNRTADAITVFTRLTEDYPELPEPYNNLAVLYAQQRQYDKARNALEMAIRTHPAYATAYENLGDIYARMANQAYDKALQLDSSNVGAQAKLAMIRDLVSATTRPAPARSGSSAPAEPVSQGPARAKPVAEAKTVEPSPTESQPQATATATAAEANSGAASSAEAAIARAVEDWASDWSSKDVRAYLAHYAEDFRTPRGQTRSAWSAIRTRRISKPGAIDVTIEDMKISLEGDARAVARFRQHYRSVGFNSSSNKVLVLIKRDGKWLIEQERVGA